MNKKNIAIHGLVLAAINLIALYIGLAWDTWTHLQHPFAAQIPVGALVTVVGFPVWYQAIKVFSSGNSSLQSQSEWRRTYVTALALGPAIFVIYNFLIHSQSPSLGRVITLIAFQALVNVLSLQLAFATRNINFGRAIRDNLRKPWVSRIVATFISMLIGMILLLMVEGAFYVLNSAGPAKPEKVYEGEYLLPGKIFQEDQLLGISLKPNSVVTSILTIDGVPTWDVVYGIDQYGRRRTVSGQSNAKPEFALFFGDSFTFGEGSNDDQTIPSRFESSLGKYSAYNYGVPGYGPQQMLAKLQSKSLRNEVPEKRGLLFYIYLEDVHEGRVIGQMNVVNAWAANFPYYDLNNDGNLVNKGTFTIGRPILSTVFRLLGKTQTARYLGLNLPNLGEEHYRLTAKVIEESRKLYEQQFHNSDFYVVLFPKKDPHRKIVPYLERAGIKYLDYFDLFDPNANGLSFSGDGHPTPQANRIFSERLALDIAASKRDVNSR